MIHCIFVGNASPEGIKNQREILFKVMKSGKMTGERGFVFYTILVTYRATEMSYN